MSEPEAPDEINLKNNVPNKSLIDIDCMLTQFESSNFFA